MRSRKQSLYTKAREAFLKGLNIAQKKKIKRHEAHFLHSNADVYNHLHDAIQADAFYKSAAEAYQQLGDTLGMARLENNRALLLKDNPGEALTMLEAALKKYIVLKNTRGQGIAFLNKGNIYFNLNRLDECRLSYQRALEAFRQSGYVSGQAKALFSLGNVYVRQQEYEEGLKAYTAAQEFFKKINNMEGEAAALTGIGGVYRTKEPQKALTFYQSALGLTKNPYQQAVVHGNIANIYSDKMEFDNAISAYKKALDDIRPNPRLTLRSTNAGEYRPSSRPTMQDRRGARIYRSLTSSL